MALKGFGIEGILGVCVYPSDAPTCAIQIHWIPCIIPHGLHWEAQQLFYSMRSFSLARG